jgi:DNA-binding FadR family transcriptional regulator
LIKTLPSSGGAVIIEPTSYSVEQPLGTMLTLNQIRNSDLLEYRTLNEIATARWAAERRTDKDLESIMRHIRQSELVGDDFSEFVSHDLQFHQAIAAAGRNSVSGMVNRVMHMLVACKLEESFARKTAESKHDMMQTILASHREIYQAIADRDAGRVQKIMREHMDLFAEDLNI